MKCVISSVLHVFTKIVYWTWNKWNVCCLWLTCLYLRLRQAGLSRWIFSLPELRIAWETAAGISLNDVLSCLLCAGIYSLRGGSKDSFIFYDQRLLLLCIVSSLLIIAMLKGTANLFFLLSVIKNLQESGRLKKKKRRRWQKELMKIFTPSWTCSRWVCFLGLALPSKRTPRSQGELWHEDERLNEREATQLKD